MEMEFLLGETTTDTEFLELFAKAKETLGETALEAAMVRARDTALAWHAAGMDVSPKALMAQELRRALGEERDH